VEKIGDALLVLPGGNTTTAQECVQCVYFQQFSLSCVQAELSHWLWGRDESLASPSFSLARLGVPSVFVSCACHESESCVITKHRKKKKKKKTEMSISFFFSTLF
jgi:hypothetical protein